MAQKQRIKNLKWFTAQYKSVGYDMELAKSGHFKVTDPEGRFVTTISATPSDWRSDKNAQAKLKRYERERAERNREAIATVHAAAKQKEMVS